MSQSGNPFLPPEANPAGDRNLVLPDLLAGLLSQVSVEAVAVEPSVAEPEETNGVMPDFLASLRSLLTVQSDPDPLSEEFAPDAAEDLPDVTNDLLTYLLSKATQEPVAAAPIDEAPVPVEAEPAPFEDVNPVQRGLLDGLMESIDTGVELSPTTQAFVGFKQNLLEGLLGNFGTETDASPAYLEVEPESAAPIVEAEPELESVPEIAMWNAMLGNLLSAAEPLPLPPLEIEPASSTAALPAFNDLTRGLLDGLLATLTVDQPFAAAPALGHGLGEVPLEYVDESDAEAAERPAGPFELLLDAIDAELPAPPKVRDTMQHAEPIATSERFVAFDLAGQTYAFPFDQVLETDRVPLCTHVPGMPSHVRGVLNLRGEILPLVDLRILFGLAAGDSSGRMLVIRDGVANAPLALVVDRLEGLTSFTLDSIARRDSGKADLRSGVLRGFVSNGGRRFGLLDLERVLAAVHGDDPALTGSDF